LSLCLYPRVRRWPIEMAKMAGEAAEAATGRAAATVLAAATDPAGHRAPSAEAAIALSYDRAQDPLMGIGAVQTFAALFAAAGPMTRTETCNRRVRRSSGRISPVRSSKVHATIKSAGLRMIESAILSGKETTTLIIRVSPTGIPIEPESAARLIAS